MSVALGAYVAGLPVEEQAAVDDLIQPCHLTSRMQDQLVEMLTDIQRQSSQSLRSVVSAIGVPGMVADTPKDRGRKVLEALSSFLHPQLDRDRQEFARLKRCLGFDGSTIIEPPEGFEGDSMRVSFVARSAEEFRDQVAQLERIAAAPDTQRLFEF